MDLYKAHLSSPGSIRDMAALLLGRLLTRPDLEPALAHFLNWAGRALHTEGPKAHFLIPGGRVSQISCMQVLSQHAGLKSASKF